uniref:Secreted protein n=1 Tax=Physcomitrium patens TaxID=3218 RepID=A0A2K1KXA3_PHYPA|nr:hypothetical protein PHYPA_005403 [Physcomitrium patens]
MVVVLLLLLQCKPGAALCRVQRLAWLVNPAESVASASFPSTRILAGLDGVIIPSFACQALSCRVCAQELLRLSASE